MSDWLGIGLTVFLLLFNGFFVGAEFALISARRTGIEPLASGGSRRARTTLRAMENVSLMMAGAQLGITICSLALGALSEPAIAHLLEVPMAALGVPDVLLHPIAFTIALSLVTFLHVVIGEMVPKNIALAGPDRAALVLGPMLVVVVRILLPVIWVLNQVANLVLRLLRVEPKDEVTSTFTRDEVAELVGESRQGGLLDERDERLLLGALSFQERPTSSVMLGLQAVRTVPEGATHAAAEQAAASGFSRFPVRRTDGGFAGYVHVKDVIATERAQLARPMDPGLVRPLPTVGADRPLREALRVMQEAAAHLALVVDAQGHPTGLVALEDVLEELVGQIRDDSRRLEPRG